MKASELRIGNIANVEGNELIIDGRVICDIWTGEITDVEPVHLTEEWLLKFGWVWNDECKSYEKYPNGDARLHLQYRDVSGSYTMFNYVLRAIIAERIIYVHQLQNLYFSLTGQELTIKELANV